ncbi:methyltransferase, FkbM family [Candidatus Nitrosopumilus salaria BD31]|uniref:Methyltransferase, FkbM family n=2 Tax=Nitrosopumilus TaxID=338191 RepID=I3D5D8_9ARCH|nr:methyltransferase, FkbM family [Candidatus Nitrosopumilus salaria BD31]
MGLSFWEKLKILIKSIKMVKNWYWIPLIYLDLVKKEKIVLKMRENLNIVVRGTLSDIMQFSTVWLIKDYEHPDFTIDDTDTIIDVGSHIGLFSIYAAQKCNHGQIFSFEPVKTNYEIFLENIQLNNLKNIFPQNMAVSKETSQVMINLHEDESGHSMFRTGGKEVKVKSTSLKDFFEENSIKRCNLVKMDCEGAEYEIIDSIPAEYLDIIDKFIIEYHFEDEKPDAVKKLIEKLKSNSFAVEKKEWKDGMGLIYAKSKKNAYN